MAAVMPPCLLGLQGLPLQSTRICCVAEPIDTADSLFNLFFLVSSLSINSIYYFPLSFASLIWWQSCKWILSPIYICISLITFFLSIILVDYGPDPLVLMVWSTYHNISWLPAHSLPHFAIIHVIFFVYALN